MSVPYPHDTIVRDWFRALLLGDLPTLSRLSLPDPGLAALVRRSPRPAVARVLRELDDMRMSLQAVGKGRYCVLAWLSGSEHALVLQDTVDGPRVDVPGSSYGPQGSVRAS